MSRLLTDAEMRQLELMKEQERRLKENKIAHFVPNAKQLAYYQTTKDNTEAGLFGGNRTGKSEGVGFAIACHATGIYPNWWPGRRMQRACRIWICGEDLEVVRDVMQFKLLGMHPTETGTGYIPKKNILDVIANAGSVRNVADMILVRHATGGTSVVKTKSYKAGRTDFASDSLDFIWADEEPDMDIYLEMLTRVVDRNGQILLSMTPHKGMTPLTRRFIEEGRNDVAATFITIDDAAHLTEEQKRKQKERYPEHEQDARLYGIPRIGSGMVFAIDEKEIVCDPFPIPDHWFVLAALDFTHSSSSTGHPFAMTWMAFDRDTDTAYLYDEYKKSGASTADHVLAWRQRGEHIPVAWPKDGTRTEAGSNGIQLAQTYRDAGMLMLDEFASLPESDASVKDGASVFSVEAGIKSMLDAMKVGKFKVFRTCQGWLQEKRSYYRDDEGKIKKVLDDLMDASRYNYVMRRFAVQKSQVSRSVSLAPMVYKSRYS